MDDTLSASRKTIYLAKRRKGDKKIEGKKR